MDQAALQRVALVRTSGTLCWTVWGAREQQSLRTWIVSFFLESAVTQMTHSSEEWCLLWISRLILLLLLQCTAGTLLRRRHLQIFFSLAPSCIDDVSTATASMLNDLARAMKALDGKKVVMSGDGWSLTGPVWPLCCSHWAAPRNGEGHKTLGSQCPLPPALACTFWYLLFFWIWAREQVLVRRLWEAGLPVCSNCDFLLSPWQQRRSPVSLFWVATNSFVARSWVCCGGQYNCKLAANNLFFLLLNPLFGPRQTHFVLNQTPEQELVRGLWEAECNGVQLMLSLVVY